MKAKEKQIIAILSAAIAVVAVALIFCLATENRSSSGEQKSAALEDQDTEAEATEAEDDPDTSNDASSETTAEDDGDSKSASEIMDADDGYVFPNSNSSYLTEEEIEKLSTEEIQYAINEVYARHGLKFTKKSNQERFEKKKWYTGTVDDQDEITLNQYEKKNIDLMAGILEERGAR